MAEQIDDYEIRKMLGEYDAATTGLAKFSSSNPLGMRRNAEQKFAIAYQKLVKAGLRQQVRAKYRKM